MKQYVPYLLFWFLIFIFSNINLCQYLLPLINYLTLRFELNLHSLTILWSMVPHRPLVAHIRFNPNRYKQLRLSFWFR